MPVTTAAASTATTAKEPMVGPGLRTCTSVGPAPRGPWLGRRGGADTARRAGPAQQRRASWLTARGPLTVAGQRRSRTDFPRPAPVVAGAGPLVTSGSRVTAADADCRRVRWGE